MVHKPKHKVHSFRGLLTNGGQDEINLERQNLNLAYRITKFRIMGPSNNVTLEACVKIFKESQSSIDGNVSFSNPDLLAASIYIQSSSTADPEFTIVIFDNTLFSRNIFVTHSDTQSNAINYYIEIEEVPVTASTLMQLKLAVARKLSLTQDPES